MAVRSRFPEAITEDLLIVQDFQDFSLSVDIGLTFKVELELSTSNADTAEGIAAVIDGASRATYGLFKLGLVVSDQLADTDEELTPDVKEGLITLNDIVRTIKAKSRDTNVWISMAPDTGTMLRMLEYWPALSELLASE